MIAFAVDVTDRKIASGFPTLEVHIPPCMARDMAFVAMGADGGGAGFVLKGIKPACQQTTP